MNETIHKIRNILKSKGLEQYTNSKSCVNNSSRSSGDYSIKYERITKYTRRGIGYKIKQTSVKTGKIIIVCFNQNTFIIAKQIFNNNNNIIIQND